MSARAELKKEILDEVLSLDTVMRELYSKFGIVHKAVVHLYGHQQHYTKITRTLTYIHEIVDHVQTWKIRYKGAPLHLHKIMKL